MYNYRVGELVNFFSSLGMYMFCLWDFIVFEKSKRMDYQMHLNSQSPYPHGQWHSQLQARGHWGTYSLQTSIHKCFCTLHRSSYKHSVLMLCPSIASVLAMLVLMANAVPPICIGTCTLQNWLFAKLSVNFDCREAETTVVMWYPGRWHVRRSHYATAEFP